MPTEIRIDGEYAVELSTYSITCNFKDDTGDATAPVTATWTLTDIDGTVINSREDVAIVTPEATEIVALSGDDLAISSGFTGEAEKRIFTIEATYTSDLGVGLPLKDQLIFPVFNLGAIT